MRRRALFRKISSVAPPPPVSGLIHYLDGEFSSGVMADKVSTGNNATLVNCLNASGKIAGGIRAVKASDSYMTVTIGATKTISMWLNPISTAVWGMIIDNRSGTGAGIVSFGTLSGVSKMWVNRVEVTPHYNQITGGVWKHYVFEFTSLQSGNMTFFSRYTIHDGYDGYADEIGFYNKSLSLAEIEQIYNNGNGTTI